MYLSNPLPFAPGRHDALYATPRRQTRLANSRPRHTPTGEPRDTQSAHLRRLFQLQGVGVMLAVLIVLFWPGSSVVLGLGALGVAAALLLGALLVIHMARRRIGR